MKLAHHLELPDDAVTQTFAFLARRGAGKTYGASKLAEELFDAGAQIVVLDPVGVWYGLRLAADGKSTGLPIPVLGGLHGDVPLEPGAGAMVADLVVDRGTSVVLDVSMFRKGDRKRFATDFAEQLFHRKKAQRSPVHLFIEEAQVFVPQRVGPDEARLLGAFEDLVKLGRNFGIGVTLISQRPQAVNKDALNQTECLVVLQTNGAQERKALRDWIVEQGLDVGDLVDSLPGLKRGEAWVWSPSWLGITKKVQIAHKRTFDASRTPDQTTKAVAPRPLDGGDLEQLRNAMKSVVEKVEQEDPKALRRRIVELQKQLQQKMPPAPATKVERVEVPVLKDGQVARFEKAAEKVLFAATELGMMGKELQGALQRIAGAGRAPSPAPLSRPAVPPPRPARVAPPPSGALVDAPLKKGAREMLLALATLHPKLLTRHHVGTFVGLPEHGSTFTSYLSSLRKGGYIEERGDYVELSESGVDYVNALGWPKAPVSTEERVGLWSSKLKAGARAMLRQLVNVYPDSMLRAALGASVNLPSEGSTFTSYLSSLRKNGLLEESGDELRASETLFLGGST